MSVTPAFSIFAFYRSAEAISTRQLRHQIQQRKTAEYASLEVAAILQ
jgi:hypothetical protein